MEHEIISRSEAKRLGLEFFFTGKPCVRGGIGQRRTSNKRCCCERCRDFERERNRQSKRESYKDNREVLLERQNSYYEKNREAILLRSRERYKMNRAANLARSSRYYGQNREKVLESSRLSRGDKRQAKQEYDRQHYQDNIDVFLEKKRAYRERNPDKEAASKRRYYKANRDKFRAHGSKYRAAKRERIPAWFGELDQFLLEEAFDLAAERESATGIEWHVDHMVPLQARKACGLHCADNIQVIPAAMNLSKRNKMLLTEPLAWLR